jgi:hypothetical protein
MTATGQIAAGAAHARSRAGFTPAVMAQLEQMADASNQERHWALVQPGSWVSGASPLAQYLQIMSALTLEGRLA